MFINFILLFLGDKMIRFITDSQSNINTDTLQLGTCVFGYGVGATGAIHGNTDGMIFQMTRDTTQYCMFQIGFDYYGVYIRKSWAASSPSWSNWVQLI